MPIYEYECPACDKTFEMQQRISDPLLTDCPECGGAVRKIVSMSAFHLKGSGWYADGYSCASNGAGKKGGASEKKESSTPPPCQGGAGACKSCPASA